MSENTPVPPNLPRLVVLRTFWIAFVVLCLISGAWLALEPRVYFSEATVEFSATPTNSISASGTKPTRNLPQQIKTEMQVIDSLELQRRVIEDLRLDAVWGKTYNDGARLSLSDCVKMLRSRTDLSAPRGAPGIIIRVYSGAPAESAEIANSIAQTYCNNFTESRHIYSRILKPAESPGKVTHVRLIFAIPKAFVRSLTLASLAALVAWGIVVAYARASRMPPPVPSGENAPRCFQKY